MRQSEKTGEYLETDSTRLNQNPIHWGPQDGVIKDRSSRGNPVSVF